MAKDDREIVSALRATLAGKVGLEVYELWFARVRFDLTDDGLHVVAPDPFTLDRLRHKLRRDLEEAGAAVAGRSLAVKFSQAKSGKPASVVVAPSPIATPGREESSMPASTPAPARSTGPARGRTGGVAALRIPLPDRSATPAAAAAALAVAESLEELPRRRMATLETFVVGPGNQLALSAAKSVVARPGVASPLLIYGPHGSGKTHLLEGLLAAARRDRRLRRTLMISAEQFTTQFLEALQGSGLPSFRRKVRDVDLLIIDDIQFLGGKKATLLEFQHTLDGLQRAGRQVVLAADRAPHDLTGLGADIVARLTGGLVCPVESSDETVRRGIVRQAAQRLELKLTPSVFDYVVDSLPGDARQLLGALNRLDATVRALGGPLTLDVAQRALADLVRGSRRLVRLPDIERAVCQVFGLDARSLQSDSKSRTVTQPRMLAMWLARKYTRAGLAEIGKYFGRRSHTTVIAAHRKMDDMLDRRVSVRLDAGLCSIHDALRQVEGELRTGAAG